MYKEIVVADCVGRTIKCVITSANEEQVALVFTDETFTTLEIYHSSILEGHGITQGKMDVFRFNHDVVTNSGIATVEELARLLVKMNEQRAADIARTELAQYERLKAKFGR